MTTSQIRDLATNRVSWIETLGASANEMLQVADASRTARAASYADKVEEAVERRGVLSATVGGYRAEVDLLEKTFRCSCPDHSQRGVVCKHLVAMTLAWREQRRAEWDALNQLLSL